MAGYTRAAVSCTFSTTGFQNSRNKVQALLAEAFGNSSVWSQHVTNGIINVLYSITPSWHFGTKAEDAEVHSAGSGHGLGFPLQNVSKSPEGEKVMLIVTTWWMSSEGPQHKNKHDQWNSATDSCCFFHIQVCKFLFEDAAYEMIWMGTLWFLAPVGFQSPQRPPAPRQWHAQGQAWRKAAHERDLAKNPSKPFGQRICQRICQERCRFQNSFSLPLKSRIWFFIEGLAKPFCIQDRFDIATCGHSQLEVSANADNGEVYDRYLIFETPRVAVKALHTFWVVYPPKASLKSDILEARHRVRSFNLLGKLLKKAQKKSEPLTRSDLASKLRLAASNQQSLVTRMTWSQSVWWKKKSCPSCQFNSRDSTFLGTKDVLEVLAFGQLEANGS